MGYLIIPTILAAILYRLGGQAKQGNWLDNLRDTNTRDIGVPLVCLAYVIFKLYIPALWYMHLIVFVLAFLSHRSYYDWTGADNFFMVGFGFGLAYIPYAIVTGRWLGWAIRTIVLCLSVGLINKFANSGWSNSDDIEEWFRGGIQVATLPLLLI